MQVDGRAFSLGPVLVKKYFKKSKFLDISFWVITGEQTFRFDNFRDKTRNKFGERVQALRTLCLDLLWTSVLTQSHFLFQFQLLHNAKFPITF